MAPQTVCLSVLLIVLTITAGCGTQLQRPTVANAMVEQERKRQLELAIKDGWQRQQKLLRISHQLSVKGAELCGNDVEHRAGFVFADQNSLPLLDRETVAQVLGIKGDDFQITYVAPGLPADIAGLRAGDVVLKLMDLPVGEVTDPSTSRVKWITQVLKDNGESPFEIEIRRGEETKKFTIQPVPMCRFAVSLVVDNRVNAFADGERIGVTAGMMRFANHDDELAFIISHEIAHNALGHLTRTRGNQLVGGLLGLLLDASVAALGVNTGGVFTRAGMDAANLVFSQDFELEADYLAVYIAARAGFDVTKAPDFFRRMSNEHPGAIKGNFLSTHPSNPERTLAIESAIRELQQKILTEEPLMPARMPKVTPVNRKQEDQPRYREFE